MDNVEGQYINFDEYIRHGEPGKRERADAWRVAIGLQAVDGLKTSAYLQETARRNIEGEITIDEARELVKQYYVSKTTHDDDDDDKEEADRVSANITKILGEPSFMFSLIGYTGIHHRIFDGVFKFAGQIRDYEISKKEWVLRGDTVSYGYSFELRNAIEYDLNQEKEFSYVGLPMDEVIRHLAKFIAGLWQIHPFGEGNTRTTAVFCIKYLRHLGFEVDNTLFERHSWYFRNALVRANYKNYQKGIDYEPMFLIAFFRNLLLGEKNELRNRYMLINPPEEWQQEADRMKTRLVGSATDRSTSGRLQGKKYPTSTRQVPDMLKPNSPQVEQMVKVIGNGNYSIKEMLALFQLKDRENFMDNYLTPAIREGFVTMLYPNSPRHPRQKYLLTVKGMSLYNELMKS